MYLFNDSYILNVSFKRLFGRKRNFSIGVYIVVGIGSWWMKSNISL